MKNNVTTGRRHERTTQNTNATEKKKIRDSEFEVASQWVPFESDN